MIDDTFLTIASPSSGSYREKGSKFLAFAYPVSSEESIKIILQDLKKQYYDARHICYAFILGPSKEYYRAQDAGEPPHTAGDPILNEIRSTGITDAIVVVVRYFGGTKLGKSGLILAYREAAADALRNAVIITKSITEILLLEFNYSDTNEVQNHITNVEAEIISEEFDVNCKMWIAVKKSRIEQAINKFSKFLKAEKETD